MCRDDQQCKNGGQESLEWHARIVSTFGRSGKATRKRPEMLRRNIAIWPGEALNKKHSQNQVVAR
jgi:hypothetical protein